LSSKGVIAFIDERYKWKTYRDCFPKSWNIETVEKPGEKIKQFFDRNTY